ncbi:hypothetical protein P8452_48170 [Trifolium repens]|nr:hypothetical protein P8452_48170 [Trifolium repens]
MVQLLSHWDENHNGQTDERQQGDGLTAMVLETSTLAWLSTNDRWGWVTTDKRQLGSIDQQPCVDRVSANQLI